MNEYQINMLEIANACLANVGLPLIQERVVLVQIKNIYGKATVYPANQNVELIAAIAGMCVIDCHGRAHSDHSLLAPSR